MLKKIIHKLTQKQKTLSMLLGALSAMGFAPFYLIWLTLLCVVIAWKLADTAKNLKQVTAIGYWFGFGLFATGFYWVGNALLIDAVTFGWLYPFALFGAGAFFGLFTIIPFMVWRACFKVSEKIVGFAASWVLMEWIRSFFLTGFPWNLLGTIWTFNPLFIQTASVWGTYGLGFITLLLAGSVYLCIEKRFKIGMSLFVGILSGLAVFGFWRMSDYDKSLSDIAVRVVQPSIPQQMKWSRQAFDYNLEQYVVLSRENAPEKLDFVIWGETAVTVDLDYDEFYRNKVLQAVPDNGYLITGVLRYDSYKVYNSMYVLDKTGEVVGFYDKNHLVPFGEYIPLRQFLPEWIRPVTNNIGDLGSGRKYKSISVGEYPLFGGLICYEIIFPDEVINRKNKPAWLVVLANDGWYGNSAGPYQHLAATTMRAVEEGVTIVRSANSGISAIFFPTGEVMSLIPLNKKGYIDILLPKTLSLHTVYNYYGNKMIICAMLLILCYLCLNGKLRKNNLCKK